MSFRDQLYRALALLGLLTLLLGVGYPLGVTLVAQMAFPEQADGSLLRASDGRVVGSALIAQRFDGSGYFHPRPSYAGSDGYDALASGGSNLAPTSSRWLSEVERRAELYRRENGLSADHPVPVDAVTASASGLDPDISLDNAYLQAPRVARSRGMTEEQVRALIDRYAEGPQMGLFGVRRVNVLRLNLALDQIGK